MVYGPPGFSTFRPWSNVGPRQMWMPRPTRPMMNFNYTNQCCNSYGSGMGNGAWWALGIGGLIGFLPTILGWFGIGNGGGGGKAAAETTLTQSQTDTAGTIANLKTAYGDYNWINQDGVYYGYDKNNKVVAQGATFADIKAAMDKLVPAEEPEKEKADELTTEQYNKMEIKALKLGYALQKTSDCYTLTDGDGKKVEMTLEDNTKITAFSATQLQSAIPQLEKAKAKPDKEPEIPEEVTAFNTNEAVTAKEGKITKNDDGTYTLTYKDGENTITVNNLKDIASAYTQLGLNANGTPIKKGGGNGSGKGSGVQVPNNWPLASETDLDSQESFPGSKRSLDPEYLTPNNAHTQGYRTCSNATEVTELLITKTEAKGFKYMPPNLLEVLVKQIIQYNPSIFETSGKVKSNADWSKLNLPNTEWLKTNSFVTERKPQNEEKK